MFYFHGTRKPNFVKVSRVDYREDYWRERGFKLREKLMEREHIFFDWIPAQSSVLDIGCGNSKLLYELQQKKHCTVHGIDISPLVIESLRQAGVEASIGDIQEDNFAPPAGPYDYMVLSEVLEHTSHPEELLHKLKLNTKHFILSVPNSAFYRYRLGLLFTGRFFTQWMSHPSEHLRFWSHKDFLDWLAAMGLEVVSYKASNGFELKDVWPNMFGHQMCYLATVRS